MLSAVAARKARLAQTPQQTPPPAASQSPSPAPARSTPSSPPQSKRKPTASVSSAPKRQKREHQKPKQPREKPARYFAHPPPDAFKAQDELIVVEDSDDGDDTDASDSSRDLPQVRVSTPATRGRPTKRAWSPSAPLVDSSDEDDQDEDLQEPVILDVPVPRPVQQLPRQPSSVLSSFHPILNQNVFPLPALASPGSEDVRRTIVLLRATESLALLGTYSLILLRGSISLAGVPLSPAITVHPVFAPRSSPIPLIECFSDRSPSSSPPPVTIAELLPTISAAAQDFDAVLLLQSLDTGVEGLGKVCRTFDGFLAPSRWHRDQPRLDLGIDTVYLVRDTTNMTFTPERVLRWLCPCTYTAYRPNARRRSSHCTPDVE